MPNQKLDKLILDSQDFPEVNVKKGINCWEEEFNYLLNKIFTDQLYVRDSRGWPPRILEKSSVCNLQIGQRFELCKKLGNFLSQSYPTYIVVWSQNDENILSVNKGVSPITLHVYDREALEPAKTFAKAYKKWCGQEATVTKEFVETEEKAHRMIKLEGIIDDAKEGKIDNINELVEEQEKPKINITRSRDAIEEEFKKTLLNKIQSILTEKKGKNKYYIECNYYWGTNQYGNDSTTAIFDFHLCKKSKFLGSLGGSEAGCLSINLSNLILEENTKEQIKYSANISVKQAAYLEDFTVLATKLRQELNASVEIIQKY